MNRITLAQIEAFHWVSQLQSVIKAAAKLDISQPTVSLRIRQIEAELGAPVLERHGRGIRLTTAGHAFSAHVRRVFDAYQDMQNATALGQMEGTFRIGLAEGFATACMSSLVSAVAQAFPKIRPEWTVTTSDGLERDLVDGKLDLALLVDAFGHRDIRLLPLGSQRNVWAASPRLRLPKLSRPQDLAHLTTVTTPAPTSMYRNTIGWFADAAAQPGPLCLCTSVNAAAQLVADGVGIGIFPFRMVETYRGSGALTPIATRPPLGVGRVFVADRVTTDVGRTRMVMDLMVEVTRTVGYFVEEPD
ncbi:LysR family transcriptional regulator [Acidisphaera sp. L21]|uniref:LysR family transcriptional regulator n=1 Tax=Acidisphaera sp. L21 TaxID=1641851 RepID=UPI00131CB4D3|nr:LysR family transcriptional regulator [Acidisphaera sp. L21]